MIENEPATVDDFYLPNGNALDRMRAPTLDEWTAAFAELRARGDWFERQGILQQAAQAEFYRQQTNGFNQQSQLHGYWQQNAGNLAQYQQNLMAQLMNHKR